MRGSGTPVPDLSIEVDDVDAVLERAIALGFPVEYGPTDEEWGVRRFYTRDPYGRLVNILTHKVEQRPVSRPFRLLTNLRQGQNDLRFTERPRFRT